MNIRFKTWKLRGEGRSLSISIGASFLEVAVVTRVFYIKWGKV